jgi:serine/threonine protein kinase
MARFDTDAGAQGRRIGRYEVLGEIASGGMATVYLARSLGAKGFSRLVAIKRLHPHLEAEDDFVQMFLDEARLAARIRHPNVVATLDVEDSEGLYIVMEYIEGVTLLTLSRAAQKLNERIPIPVVARVVLDTLGGLHAAHELLDDTGEFLGLVHRDVSPQNILVGTDGSSRLTDFGIAKAASRLTMTRDGQLKGKISYMAPEQTRRVEIDRRVDLFAMGICTWELLAGKRLFTGESDVEVLNQLLFEPIPRLKEHAPSIPAGLEQAVMKALERDPTQRYTSASEFGDAIEKASRVLGGPANHRAVASFVQKVAGERIARERGRISSGASPTELSTGSWKAVDNPPVTPSRVRATADAPVSASPRESIPAPAGTPLSQGRYTVPAEGSHPRLKAPEPTVDRKVRAPTLAGASLTPRIGPPRPSPSMPPRPSVPPPSRPVVPPMRSRASTVMGTGTGSGAMSDFDPALPTLHDPVEPAPEPMEFDAPAPGEATLIESSPEAFIARQLELERRVGSAPRPAPSLELDPEPDDPPLASILRGADEVPTDPPRAAAAAPSSQRGGSASFAPLPADVIPAAPTAPVFDMPPPAASNAPWSLGASAPPQAAWQAPSAHAAAPAPAAPAPRSPRKGLLMVAAFALSASAAIGAVVVLRERRAAQTPASVAPPTVPASTPAPAPPPAPTPPAAALPPPCRARAARGGRCGQPHAERRR